jgi:hypothetical protein
VSIHTYTYEYIIRGSERTEMKTAAKIGITAVIVIGIILVIIIVGIRNNNNQAANEARSAIT